MKFFKILLSTVVGVSLVALSLTPAAGAEPWKPSLVVGTEQSAALMESAATPKISYLFASKTLANGKRASVFCSEYGIGECEKGSGWDVAAEVTLGKCVGNEVNCIESVNIYSDSEAPQPAIFDTNIPGPSFAADSKIGLPRGSTVGIWKSKDLKHEGGNNNYAVWVKLSVYVNSGKAVLSKFSAGLAGVNERSDQFAKPASLEITEDELTGHKNVAVIGAGLDCLYTANGICGVSQTFAPATRAGIKLRISDNLTGWLLGRLEKPTVLVSKYATGINNLEIDAAPTTVAQHQTYFNESNFPEQFKKTGQLSFLWDRLLNKSRSVVAHVTSSSPAGISLVDAVREKDSDTATGSSTLWTVESLNDRTASNRCLADKSRLVGLVTTNAMAYEGGVPSFKNGFLEYKVAGMHNLPDGSLAQGTYDLVMRSEVARCLYKFSNAPLSATVSVVNEKGTKTTATTVVSEKNGWLKMAAYGFTFSKKTIKVKITKKKK